MKEKRRKLVEEFKRMKQDEVWDKVFLPKLKVGDLVRVKTNDSEVRNFNGKKGTVAHIDKENPLDMFPYKVIFEAKPLVSIYFSRKELTKIDKKEKSL